MQALAAVKNQNYEEFNQQNVTLDLPYIRDAIILATAD